MEADVDVEVYVSVGGSCFSGTEKAMEARQSGSEDTVSFETRATALFQWRRRGALIGPKVRGHRLAWNVSRSDVSVASKRRLKRGWGISTPAHA